MTLGTLIERLLEPLTHHLTNPNIIQHSQQLFPHHCVLSIMTLGTLTEKLLKILAHHLAASCAQHNTTSIPIHMFAQSVTGQHGDGKMSQRPSCVPNTSSA